jgi:hypothetical protein
MQPGRPGGTSTDSTKEELMTTGKRSYYHPAPYSQDLGVITAKPFTCDDGSVCAVVDLASDRGHPRAGELWISDPARARELLSAAFEALMILDPDGEVTVRTGNAEIHTVAEILPGPELDDPWTPERGDVPVCGAVTTPVGTNVPEQWRCARAVGHPYLHETEDGGAWGGSTPPEVAPFTHPDLVILPAAKGTTCARCGDDESLELHLDPGGQSGEMRCTNPGACGRRRSEAAQHAPVETGEPWRGAAQHEWDESR